MLEAFIEAASNEQQTQIYVAVTVAAAQVGRYKDRCSVQQIGVYFLCVSQVCHQHLLLVEESPFDAF